MPDLGRLGVMSETRDPGADGTPHAGAAHARWPGWAMDLTAALVVVLGGSVLAGVLGIGFGGGPGLGPFGPFGRFDGADPGGPPPAPPAEAFALRQTLGLLLLFLAAGLMFLRRRHPLTVFATAFACFVGTELGELPSIGPGIALTIAAFTLANRAARRTAFIATAIAAGCVLLLSLALTGWDSFSPRALQVAAAVAIAAALGDSTRSRHAFIAAVTERAERAEQTREAEASRRVTEERLRIARELHDTVAHQLAVINLNAGLADGLVASQPERARDALAVIREAARGGIAEIGELLRYLRTEATHADADAPQPGLDRLGALVAGMREAGLDLAFRLGGDPGRVSGAAGRTAYRVAQEALTNALKHGTERRAELNIDIGEDALRIECRNPVGPAAAQIEAAQTAAATQAPPPAGDEPASGLGLLGIRERVTALGGSVEAGLADGAFRLSVKLPLTGAASAETAAAGTTAPLPEAAP